MKIVTLPPIKLVKLIEVELPDGTIECSVVEVGEAEAAEIRAALTAPTDAEMEAMFEADMAAQNAHAIGATEFEV